MARRALTLVELLVIVSIAILIIAILLPALKKGPERSTRVHCMANLRGVAQASLIYAEQDASESILPVSSAAVQLGVTSQLPAYAYGGKSGAGSGGPDSLWGLRAGMAAADRPLNFILYKQGYIPAQSRSTPHDPVTEAQCRADAELELSIYNCPSDQGFTGLHHRAWRRDRLSSYHHYGTSFAANILYATVESDADRLVSVSPYLHKLSRVPAPTDTILFIENSGRFVPMKCTTDYSEGCPLRSTVPTTGGEVSGWHGSVQHFNIGFLDGHANWLRMDGHKASQKPEALPIGQDQNLHVRGLGWRLDVLPTRPAVTSHMPLSLRPVQSGDPAAPDFELVTGASP